MYGHQGTTEMKAASCILRNVTERSDGLMATQWGKTGWKIRHAFLPSYIPQGRMGLGRVDQM